MDPVTNLVTRIERSKKTCDVMPTGVDKNCRLKFTLLVNLNVCALFCFPDGEGQTRGQPKLNPAYGPSLFLLMLILELPHCREERRSAGEGNPG